MAVVAAEQRIKIEYRLEADYYNWTQTVTDAITNVLLSSLKTSSGANIRGYGTACECQNNCYGTVVEHYYFDTVITYSAPETGFKLIASQGATFTRPLSEQGVKVWKIVKITIPPMDKGSKACKEATNAMRKANG